MINISNSIENKQLKSLIKPKDNSFPKKNELYHNVASKLFKVDKFKMNSYIHFEASSIYDDLSFIHVEDFNKFKKDKNFKKFFPLDENISDWELFFLNRIMSGVFSLTFLIGSWGSGKSTFLNYVDHIIKNIPHSNDCKSCLYKKRIYILYDAIHLKRDLTDDFLERYSNNIVLYSDVVRIIRKDIGRIIYDNICNELGIDLNEEIFDIWDDLIKTKVSSESITFIRRQLRIDKSEQNRRRIYGIIENDPDKFFDYVVNLAIYIHTHYDKRYCFILAIDNLDWLPIIVQSVIIDNVILSFYHNGIPVIISLRDISFLQRGKGQIMIEGIIRLTPNSPFKITIKRLKDFINDPNKYRTGELIRDNINIFEEIKATYLKLYSPLKLAIFSKTIKFFKKGCWLNRK